MIGRTKHPGEKKNRPRGVIQRNPETYRNRAKASGAQSCAGCGLVQHRGRWSRRAPPRARVASGLCPACRRVRDRYPAGTLRLPQDFFVDREAILRMLRHAEEIEGAEHPLERLMDVEERDGELVVTTTGVHLAREIAHELGRQFHRKPRFRYADGESLVHVDWGPPPGRTAKRSGR